MSWVDLLEKHAESHPIVIFHFSSEEWDSLVNSRHGTNEFTVARPHSCVENVKVPAPCLLLGKNEDLDQARFGLVSSKKPITTLDTRIKVTRSVVIEPSSAAGLSALITDVRHAKNLSARLQSEQPVTVLSPKLSSHLISKLVVIESNKGGLRTVVESLSIPKRFKGNAEMQQDAVKTALAAFGLDLRDQATNVELVEGRPTALSRVPIVEDAVIEHDARSVPGYSLTQSDLTGRAVFLKDDEQLEVFTANRRELEHCFGVDLIYVNLTKQNIVMLQYKMLEPEGKTDSQTDWVYRPDKQLEVEIERMNAFASTHAPKINEYRLNPQMFYLKFVKRDGALQDGGIIMPLDHFQKVRLDPSFKGQRQGLRLSYKSLNGQYLRQTPFLDLIRCGYIGAHDQTTTDLHALIKSILDGNKAVIAAIQKKKDMKT